MKNLKHTVATVALCLTLASAALAGEVSTPPCAPGEVSTPPCAIAQAGNSGETATPALAPGQINTPSAGEVSLTEIASFALLSIMSLF
jgi:hypothetical protein